MKINTMRHDVSLTWKIVFNTNVKYCTFAQVVKMSGKQIVQMDPLLADVIVGPWIL